MNYSIYKPQKYRCSFTVTADIWVQIECKSIKMASENTKDFSLVKVITVWRKTYKNKQGLQGPNPPRHHVCSDNIFSLKTLKISQSLTAAKIHSGQQRVLTARVESLQMNTSKMIQQFWWRCSSATETDVGLIVLVIVVAENTSVCCWSL